MSNENESASENPMEDYTVDRFEFAKGVSFIQEGADGPQLNAALIREILFGNSSLPKDPGVLNALTFLIPLIDAGIDALSMEAWVKDGKYRSLSGQYDMRSNLTEGTFLAFEKLGISQRETEAVISEVESSGWTMKQDAVMIADRVTVWDDLSITNILYGPRVTGEILHQKYGTPDGDITDDESVSTAEFEEARKVHAQTCPICRED